MSNVPGTAVQIWTADLPKEGRYAMFKKLSRSCACRSRG